MRQSLQFTAYSPQAVYAEALPRDQMNIKWNVKVQQEIHRRAKQHWWGSEEGFLLWDGKLCGEKLFVSCVALVLINQKNFSWCERRGGAAHAEFRSTLIIRFFCDCVSLRYVILELLEKMRHGESQGSTTRLLQITGKVHPKMKIQKLLTWSHANTFSLTATVKVSA